MSTPQRTVAGSAAHPPSEGSTRRPNLITRTLHPAWYHGVGKRPPFFEGWYFKLIDAQGDARYAIIPGVFLNRDPEQQHAFIQVLNGATGASAYYRFPLADFTAAPDRFEIQIGPNSFSTQGMRVDLTGGAIAVRGEVAFDGVHGWPVTLRSPGIMGWYAWVPAMECYHGVLSFDHALSGTLEIDGQPRDFSGGRGYIEKDWGQSFPAAWVWLQTNHFGAPGTSLTASVAMIPWIGRAFRGFIVGLWHDQQLYRFATYTGARIETLAITDDAVDWVMRDKRYRLRIHATRTQGGLLHEPSRVAMHERVNETLQATADVRLTRLEGDREVEIFNGTGHHGGLEVQGDLARLLKG